MRRNTRLALTGAALLTLGMVLGNLTAPKPHPLAATATTEEALGTLLAVSKREYVEGNRFVYHVPGQSDRLVWLTVQTLPDWEDE